MEFESSPLFSRPCVGDARKTMNHAIGAFQPGPGFPARNKTSVEFLNPSRQQRFQIFESPGESGDSFLIPSQVIAILIRTRSRSIPPASYCAMMSRPLAIVASVSYDNRASTSVETRPGTIFRMRLPNSTARRSKAGEAIFLGSPSSPSSFRGWRRVPRRFPDKPALP